MATISIMSLMVMSYAITHSTVFHSDEVFATALLRLINPKINIVRTIRPTAEQLEDLKFGITFAYDIGCQFGHPEYDHHQNDKAIRPDGTPYCSFGLLWRDLGEYLCPMKKAWDKVDQELVLAIDKADNGVEANLLSASIGQFNPSWKDEIGLADDQKAEQETAAFWAAEAFAEVVLSNAIKRANDTVEAEEELLASRKLDGGQILVLDRYLPWDSFVATDMPQVKFVIYPSKRGGYNVQKAPVEPGSFEGRCHFPQRWLGNPDTNLGMTFCHPNNFLAATDTLEHAVQVARIAIDEYQKEKAAEFLLTGYRNGQVLTTAGNIHLFVENEEYVFIWADGQERKYLGSWEDACCCPIIDEGDVKKYVAEFYIG